MKLRVWVIGVLISTAFLSCQKAYSPDGFVLPGTDGTNTALLVQSESNTSGTTEGAVKTYEYDGSRRIVKITTVATDSFSVSTTYVYRFIRDADGKITQVRTNALAAGSPNAGFPDSLTIDVHYPAGSTNYDYATYSFGFLGDTVYDSVVYSYSNNAVSETREYQKFIDPSYALIGRTQFSYSGSNISSAKIYDPSTNALAATISYEYDNKFIAFGAGKESFLPGLDHLMSNANNVARAILSFSAGSPPPITLEYSYQYNSGNVPVSGIAIETPNTKTTLLKFSYQ